MQVYVNISSPVKTNLPKKKNTNGKNKTEFKNPSTKLNFKKYQFMKVLFRFV